MDIEHYNPTEARGRRVTVLAEGGEEDYAFTSRDELEVAYAKYEENQKTLEKHPGAKQLLGPVSVCCLVINRAIGSGIFAVPGKVLIGTGGIGPAILLWSFTGLIMICGLLCWLELGLTVPYVWIQTEFGPRRVSTTRNGSENTFLQYLYSKPKLLTICVYGIMFLVFGNISGNAIAFGIYTMKAGGHPEVDTQAYRGAVIAIAIAALTFAALLHMFTRRGGILVTNIFAAYKVGLMLAIILIGLIHTGGKFWQSPLSSPQSIEGSTYLVTADSINSANKHNFGTSSFPSETTGFGGTVMSFLLVIFSYAGFDQPFQVLTEVSKPHKTMPRYTILSMVGITVLYVMANISYFCVVPKEVYLHQPEKSFDMAGTFFHFLLDTSEDDRRGERMAAGLVAVSILGNLLAITFTAARVKQAIAQEGILPYSITFATGQVTPWAKFWAGYKGDVVRKRGEDSGADDDLERSPIAALALHLFTSIFLVAVTAGCLPSVAYSILTSLYGYVNVGMIGMFVSGGLLYAKADAYFRPDKNIEEERKYKSNYHVWFDPLHAVIYFVVMTFFCFAAFANPASTPNSPFQKSVLKYDYYIVPLIGLTSLFWGVLWWLQLLVIQRNRHLKLEVHIRPFVEQDEDGHYVRRADLIEHEWVPTSKVS